MGKDSKIEWCTNTFNPWWGCEKVSPACAHCYAETWAKRCGAEVWGAKADRRVFGEKHWNEPLKWNAEAGKTRMQRGRAFTQTGTNSLGQIQATDETGLGVVFEVPWWNHMPAVNRPKVFCASMADVFEDRPELQVERERLWLLIDATPNLDWLLLTKRPENARRMLLPRWLAHGMPDNVWMGTTVENQAMAEERIPALLGIEAKARFLSCEPLLEAVDLASVNYCANCFERAVPGTANDGTPWCSECDTEMCGYVLDPLNTINWVICGGESGAGEKTRPMHPDWARSLRDQCAAAGVAFLFKQWGDWTEIEQFDPTGDSAYWWDKRRFMEPRFHSAAVGFDGRVSHDAELVGKPSAVMHRVGKKEAGRRLDGVEHNGFPEIEA